MFFFTEKQASTFVHFLPFWEPPKPIVHIQKYQNDSNWDLSTQLSIDRFEVEFMFETWKNLERYEDIQWEEPGWKDRSKIEITDQWRNV